MKVVNDEYAKYLSTKLYLIESLSLKGMLAGNEQMKKIHDICLASFSEIEEMVENHCPRRE